jgi:hypothetical protein
LAETPPESGTKAQKSHFTQRKILEKVEKMVIIWENCVVGSEIPCTLLIYYWIIDIVRKFIKNENFYKLYIIIFPHFFWKNVHFFTLFITVSTRGNSQSLTD